MIQSTRSVEPRVYTYSMNSKSGHEKLHEKHFSKVCTFLSFQLHDK